MKVGIVPLGLAGLVVLAAAAIPWVAEQLKPVGKKVGDGLKDWGDRLSGEGDPDEKKKKEEDPIAEASRPRATRGSAVKKPPVTRVAKRVAKPKAKPE